MIWAEICFALVPKRKQSGLQASTGWSGGGGVFQRWDTTAEKCSVSSYQPSRLWRWGHKEQSLRAELDIKAPEIESIKNYAHLFPLWAYSSDDFWTRSPASSATITHENHHRNMWASSEVAPTFQKSSCSHLNFYSFNP